MDKAKKGTLAKVSWNVEAGRHELRVLGRVKAYTTGPDHASDKADMVAEYKAIGYTVIQDDKQHGMDYNREYPPL